MAAIKLPAPSCDMRDDFEHGCECGTWLCLDCGWPCYPMEVDFDDERQTHECPACASVDVVFLDYGENSRQQVDVALADYDLCDSNGAPPVDDLLVDDNDARALRLTAYRRAKMDQETVALDRALRAYELLQEDEA